MRRTISALFFVMVWSALCLSASADPKITFSKVSHDFGKVLFGNTVRTEFLFTNTGTSPLEIRKLRSGCTCTKAIEGNKVLKPGESSKIVASLDTGRMRQGLETKTVRVYSNDPEKPIVKLALKALVLKELDVKPDSLAEKLTEFHEKVTFPITITNNAKNRVTIQDIEIASANSTVSMNPAKVEIEPGKAGKFDVILNLKKGNHWVYYIGNIKLKTDHPKENVITIRYLVQVDKAGF